MFLNSKDNATIVMPSAYDCKKEPARSNSMSALHALIHQCVRFRHAVEHEDVNGV